MALFKSTSPRRREVRRNLSRHRASLPSYLNRMVLAWSIAYALVLAIIASILTSSSVSPPAYIEGQMLRHTVVPRVDFKAIDKAETQLQRDEAFHYEPAVYLPNDDFFKSIRKELDNLLKLGADENILSINQISKDTVRAMLLNEEVLREMKRINNSERRLEDWNKDVKRFVNERLPDIAVFTEQDHQTENNRADRANEIALQKPNGEEFRLPDGRGYNIDGDKTPVRNYVTVIADDFSMSVRRSVIEIVMNNLQPTYFRNEDKTVERREAARDAVLPVERTYRADTVLFKPGHKLTAVDLDLLSEEHTSYLTHLGSRRQWMLQLGYMGMMLLFGIVLWSYVLAYNGRIARNPVRGFALTALLLFALIVAVYTHGYMPQFLFAAATLPTLVVALILAITYDQRFALAVGAIHALLVTVCLSLPIGFAIMLLVGLAIAVAQLNEVRTRSKLVVVGLFSGVAMALAALITGLTGNALEYGSGLSVLFNDAVIAFFSAFFAGVFVQAILPVIEKIFQVTTSMRLKELNETSRPLLRQLAENAPGTFQHSLRIADMAEAAAEAIDADGLLCRVGAMYHDVGKMNKPGYFVENQGSGPNRHDRLSPAMSLLIIVGHVKDGIEMAREAGLSPALRHFIESHHGTTLVEYFYHAAKQQQKETGDDQAPAEFTFRYPGPKPQTKEAAILMICDGVEGAARSLPEPTPIRLEQLVSTLANKRLMDGQFDESNLTLQELHKIEQAITRTIQAIHHGRIAYPKDEEEQQSSPATA